MVFCIYYTYILRCKDNSLYTGITTDVDRRFKEHTAKADGKGAKYTRLHCPTKIERVWRSKNRVLASRLEFYIKKLSKAQKEQLIQSGDLSAYFTEKMDITAYTDVKHENAG